MNTQDAAILKDLRKDIFITGYRGGMAHLASCFSCVDILYSLYMKGILRHKPNDPTWEDRDRFILSKGHGGLALYAVLCRAGYLTGEEFHTYLKPGCHIGGEPNVRDLPGIEASTGALGHGLGVGIGMALAQKIDGKGAKTYVLIGDGESEEGSIWEAAISGAAFGLDNLIAILDYNRLQKTDLVRNTIKVENWREKWKSFGWSVTETDGHDPDEVCSALKGLPADGRPKLLIAHTVKGKGVSLMENNPIWHFKLPNRKEEKVFLEELGITEEELEG